MIKQESRIFFNGFIILGVCFVSEVTFSKIFKSKLTFSQIRINRKRYTKVVSIQMVHNVGIDFLPCHLESIRYTAPIWWVQRPIMNSDTNDATTHDWFANRGSSWISDWNIACDNYHVDVNSCAHKLRSMWKIDYIQLRWTCFGIVEPEWRLKWLMQIIRRCKTGN